MSIKSLDISQTSEHSIAKTQRITGLFMGCQVNDRLWVPTRKLIWDESGYRSGNLKGAIQAITNSPIFHNYFSLSPLDRIDATREIPSDFSRRMPLDRPEEMPQHLPHLGLRSDLLDPIAYVARSGGYKQTDSFDVFPEIDPDSDGCYYFYFGLRELHLLPELKSTLSTLRPGDKIAVEGKKAIHIATNLTLGLLPGYIVAMDNENSGLLKLAIERINLDAIYTRHKIICSATCKGFVPFSTPFYQPIGDLYGKVKIP